MNKPKVGIILLNWNNEKETIPCLETLYQTNYPNYQTILVDNGSRQESLDKLKHWASGQLYIDTKIIKPSARSAPITVFEYTREETEQAPIAPPNIPANSRTLTIIKNDKNDGFARGNNIGIRFAMKDKNVEFIVLLNNDTEVDPDWLSHIIDIAQNDEKVGLCQPKMLVMANPSLIDSIGITVTNWGMPKQLAMGMRDGEEYRHNQEVFGACAGAAMYRRKMLEQIGLLDEDFFIYFEDGDLSVRARMAEWKTVYAAKSLIYHIHSATFGRNSPFKSYLLARNMQYFAFKLLPSRILIRYIFFQLGFIPLKVITFAIKGKLDLAISYLKGTFVGLCKLPTTLKKRQKLMQTLNYTDKSLKKSFNIQRPYGKANVVPDKYNVCAVIGTKEADSEFPKRVDAIVNQVAKLVIVDNNSSQEVKDMLRNIATGKNIHIIFNEMNLGIGEAFNQGIYWARDNGFAWALTFDDDSYAEPDMASTLTKIFNQLEFKDTVAMIGSNFFEQKSNQNYINPREYPKKEWIKKKSVISSGSLVSIAIFNIIGPFRGELFIDAIDTEYCLRALVNKYEVIITLKPLIKHRMGNRKIIKFPLMPWISFTVTHYPPFRRYYWARNNLILFREYFKYFPFWALTAFAHSCFSIFKAILFEEKRLRKLRCIYWGILDAVTLNTKRNIKIPDGY